MRIHITGNAGAGKTTLAKKLKKVLGLSVYHLDQIVWQPRWKKVPVDQRKELIHKLTCEPNWIIEGVSREVREAADIVVFLDMPRHRCFLRCAKRNWKYLFKPRPELPLECPEWKILPALLRIIWHFPNAAGIIIKEEARDSPKYVVLRGDKCVQEWVNEFKSKNEF